MFIVTVTFVIKEDKVKEFTKTMKAQAQNSLDKEEQCLQFDVCFDQKDPRRVFLYEVYTDKDGFDQHVKTEHFLDFDKTVRPWTESKVAENWMRYEP